MAETIAEGCTSRPFPGVAGKADLTILFRSPRILPGSAKMLLVSVEQIWNAEESSDEWAEEEVGAIVEIIEEAAAEFVPDDWGVFIHEELLDDPDYVSEGGRPSKLLH